MNVAQYRASIYARFGRPPAGEPLDVFLAGMENVQMRKAMGLQANMHMQAIGTGVVTEAMRIKLREAALAKGKERMDAVLPLLPATVDNLMERTGWSKTTVRRALNRALNEGRAFPAKKKSPQIWDRRQEAAE